MVEEGVAVKKSSNIVNAIQKHRKKWDFEGLSLSSFNVYVYSNLTMVVCVLFPMSIVCSWWFFQK